MAASSSIPFSVSDSADSKDNPDNKNIPLTKAFTSTKSLKGEVKPFPNSPYCVPREVLMKAGKVDKFLEQDITACAPDQGTVRVPKRDLEQCFRTKPSFGKIHSVDEKGNITIWDICKGKQMLGEGGTSRVKTIVNNDRFGALKIKPCPNSSFHEDILHQQEICPNPTFAKDNREYQITNLMGLAKFRIIRPSKKNRMWQEEIGMEWVQGFELQELMDLSLPLHRILEICIGMIQEVNRLHKLKWINRDISPSNFMVSDDLIRLIDFGNARKLPDEGKLKPDEVSVDFDLRKDPGGPGFIALEVLNKRIASIKSDLYSIYVIFALLLKFISAVSMKHRNIALMNRDSMVHRKAYLKVITQEDPRFKTNKIIPEAERQEYLKFVTRGLSDNPEERPSAEEFLEFLESRIKKEYNKMTSSVLVIDMVEYIDKPDKRPLYLELASQCGGNNSKFDRVCFIVSSNKYSNEDLMTYRKDFEIHRTDLQNPVPFRITIANNGIFLAENDYSELPDLFVQWEAHFKYPRVNHYTLQTENRDLIEAMSKMPNVTIPANANKAMSAQARQQLFSLSATSGLTSQNANPAARTGFNPNN